MDNKSVTPGSLPVKRDGWPGLSGKTAVVTGAQFVFPNATPNRIGQEGDDAEHEQQIGPNMVTVWRSPGVHVVETDLAHVGLHRGTLVRLQQDACHSRVLTRTGDTEAVTPTGEEAGRAVDVEVDGVFEPVAADSKLISRAHPIPTLHHGVVRRRRGSNDGRRVRVMSAVGRRGVVECRRLCCSMAVNPA
jgi:hypothetical protein